MKVSFTDDRDNGESLTSGATAAVAATLPSAPLSLIVTKGDQIRELDASWQAPSSDGGSAITGYKVQWKEAADSWAVAADVSHEAVTGTSHTITGLTGDVEYAVRVTAINDVGDSPASAEAAGTPDAGLPTISGTTRVGETLTADTSGVFDADGLTNVSYEYQWIRSTGSIDTDIAGETAITYTLVAADAGQTIKVRVSFTDDAHNQETLTSAPTTAVEDVEPRDRPYGLQATTGSGKITLTWLDPNTHASSALYTILRHRPELGEAEGLVYAEYVQITDRTFIDREVEPGVLYVYAVRAVKDLGGRLGPASDSIEIRMPPGETGDAEETNTPATGLLAITGTAQVGETLTADTSGIADEEGLTKVSYSYQWIANDGNGDTDIADATDSTYRPSVADVGKTIKVRVTFTDDADNRETLNSEATDPVAAAAPGVPEHLRVFPHGTGALDVSWHAPASDGGSDITVYKVEWKESADSWDTPADVSEATASGTAHTITGLTGGVEYSVRVSAVNDAGTGPASDPVSGTPQKAALWSATLTVGTTDDFAGYTTFLMSSETNILGALSADTFTSDDDSYSVKALGVLDGKLILTATPKLSAGFVLAVGTTEFASTDASTWERNSTSIIQFQWNDPGLDWSDGQEVAVRMTNGLPTISGTPQVDKTLTADTSPIDDVDGLTNVSYEYQWIAGGLDIAGATGSTYTLTYGEQGNTIQVRVAFTDDAENEETLTSVATVAVAAAPNREATGEPTIGGTPQVEETLTADTSPIDDPDGLTNVSYRYQWLAGGSDIAGATGSTYGLVPADAGSTIEVRVSFTDDRGNSETLTSEATVAVAATTPTEPLSLTVTQASQDQELDASWQAPSSNGGSAVTGYKVQWKEAADRWDTAADVSEATESGTAHTITGLTGGVEYAVRVIATNDAGDGPASAVAKGTPTGGVSEVEPENSAPTGLPTISGTPQVDKTLTADTSAIDDEDGLTNVSYEYQWIAGGTDIAGATGSTYALTYSEQGQTVQVRVTFTDDADNTETLTSAATVAVAAAPNREATGKPGIGGTPQVDQTLTADTSPIDDADGLTNVAFEYQWIAGGSDIDGATGSTYTLTASEQGQTIQVRVTFTDDADNEETLTSAATVEVSAAASASLTAAFQDLPDSHDGSTAFTFRVLFSEDVGISYVNMRDDAFSLSEGDVTGARRVDGRNDLWEITVEPDDNSDVGITLPANRSCTTTGAICTREDSPRQLTNSPTATVTGPAEAPPTNTSAAGAPTISGTPQVEQTLTADTSSITDEDGLTNVSYSYQWIAGGSDIAGATGSTYTLTASEQGQTVQVRVTFTDDADNEETLTSIATAEVAAAPVPLTASRPDSRFQSARHKGADDRPQVIVAFSLPVASFEKTTPSLSLTGAAVRSVRQHEEDGLDNAWIFFLDPDGSDDIVFSLVTGRPCDSGGICTEDGGMLSGGVQVTLPGPKEEEQEETGDDQQTPQSPPPAPTSLTATVNADGHIVLSWTAPSDDSITGYQVLRRRPGEGESALLVYVADTESTATTFTDTGVTAGVKYVYRVKAINAAGLSGWSNYVNPTP